jgi:hypothetical protein
MTIGDGRIATYVASHLNTAPEDVDPVVVRRGTSLRYGRIGLPAGIWLLSAGRPSAMPYVQPLIMIACGGAVAAAAARLFPAAPRPVAAAPFAAAGLTLALSGGFAEAFSIAFGLWAVVLAVEGRWRGATVLCAASMLGRENAGAVLLGLLVWASLRGTFRPASVLLLALVPLGAWYAYVAVRYGHVPVLDPYLRVRTDTIGPPVLALVRSLTQTRAAAAAVAATHAVLAVVALALWRRSAAGAVAAAAALQVFFSSPYTWHFTGEAVRTGAFLQVFLVLALGALRYAPEERTRRSSNASAASA